MTKTVKIKKGLDLKLVGGAPLEVQPSNEQMYALKPTDFIGLFPKLLVKEGDVVKVGSPVFYDKYRDEITLTSPVSGTVKAVVRGEKRKMLEVLIESDGKHESIDFGAANPASIAREEIIEKMLKSGVWPLIKQRPYSNVADPKATPKAIYISLFDSAPLAQDFNFILKGRGDSFTKGIEVLKALSDKVHLGLKAGVQYEDFITQAKGVDVCAFEGPHPAGNVGIQIHHTFPINKGESVWVCDAQAVATIGDLFLTGKYNPEVVIALAGSEVKNAGYYKTIRGASVQSFVKDNVNEGDLRYISGTVLTGDRIEKDGYLGYYHNMFTVIPEGNVHAFLGWLIPSPKKHSFFRTAMSWMTPNKEYALNTNLNGGERAFVITGELEKVFPMDIYPQQLLKSILIEDIDLMEQLGIYEVDSEDFALCEYISPSKINMQEIIANGVDMMRKEMS